MDESRSSKQVRLDKFSSLSSSVAYGVFAISLLLLVFMESTNLLSAESIILSHQVVLLLLLLSPLTRTIGFARIMIQEGDLKPVLATLATVLVVVLVFVLKVLL